MCFVKTPKGAMSIPLAQYTDEQQQSVQPSQQYHQLRYHKEQPQQRLASNTGYINRTGSAMWNDHLASLDPSRAIGLAHPNFVQPATVLTGPNVLPSASLESLASIDSLTTGDSLDVWLDLLSNDLGPVTKPLFSATGRPTISTAPISPFSSKPTALQSAVLGSATPTAAFSASSFSFVPSPPDSVLAGSPMTLPTTVQQATAYLSSTPSLDSYQQQQHALLLQQLQQPLQSMPSQCDSRSSAPSAVTITPYYAKESSKTSAASTPSTSGVSNSHIGPKRKTEDFDGFMDDLQNESTPQAIKRARNNEAARRSRERKMKRLEELEIQVSQLDTDKADLTVRLAVLENERSAWAHRERELLNRALTLEKQLNESHQALMSVGGPRLNSNDSFLFCDSLEMPSLL
ncbi:hypothetical protein BASA50_002584 [Batrachochytrium salamandrivorans]|uniref:BZIP domain-containing protein n=1 Tax=Batrachochytrium salamandrivorans TaxID=1357716 RepID=A0ABQ8FKS4_9FUNG|nr:hypothetical protein BASA60_009270 [Batrachochytrium salamandrivorans]KAH6574802.1 hypothetical protein BASA62_002289 [Batrachochytrium salamandrivorans]KAH6579386.1 hypothetical protein BASA61_010269 [Batrachochytrium salamandrivorans]KAH6599995.1 hypothetical protein BASA50_002584 [Batrachochytrium salamandrivorans]KAH9271279.1 hypothetical protein BASA83_006602 [Batrachochytrium salamandrivorans]